MAVVAQMLTAFLDLAGVLLVGVVGVCAAVVVQGSAPPAAVTMLSDRFGSGVSIEVLAGLAAIAAGALLLSKSLLSVYLTRRILVFLANRQAAISRRLTGQLLAQPLLQIEARSTQNLAYTLSTAVSLVITSGLGSLAMLLAEAMLLLTLGTALFLIDPLTTCFALVLFGLVGLGLQRLLRSWSTRNGILVSETTIEGTLRLQEALAAYREVLVYGRRALYVDSIGSRWSAGATARADQVYINQLPKFAYEAALVVGAVGLATVQFLTSSAVEAVAVLALFMAAGSRVVPSMLRINSMALSIRSGTAQADQLFPLIAEISSAPSSDKLTFDRKAFVQLRESRAAEPAPEVNVASVSFNYPGASELALANVNLFVPGGTSVALVGQTGSGKSTLADIILGVVQPTSGSVTIGGMRPETLIDKRPGLLAYVPQSVAMLNASVRDNIALGLPTDLVNDDEIWMALEQTRLDQLLILGRDGLDTMVGERGVRLSGGQRQRLGLARALYARPRVLVLDEATSALDAATEADIASTIADLGPSVTVITVAHRLATVRNADCVVYLEEGRVVAQGTFSEVRKLSSSFDKQVLLLGIT